MSRRLSALAPFVIILPAWSPLAAQSNRQVGVEDDSDPDCSRKQEAALISGEIVVCGNRAENDRHRLRPRDDAQRELAEDTKDLGLAHAPDFSPPPCKPSLLTLCPKLGPVGETPLIVDFAELPEAPAGSDADRIARGEVPQ